MFARNVTVKMEEHAIMLDMWQVAQDLRIRCLVARAEPMGVRGRRRLCGWIHKDCPECGYTSDFVNSLCSVHGTVGATFETTDSNGWRHKYRCSRDSSCDGKFKTCTNCDSNFQETYNAGCTHSQFSEHYINS